MACANLSDKANGTRLSRLLLDIGTEALRQTFNAIHPVTLAAALNTNKKQLLKLRYRVINDLQWDMLYPASSNPDSNNFDITLLIVLLRNICNILPPATGWTAMPPATDTSVAANIVRMRVFRNEVYAHVTKTEVNDAQFEILWQKISKMLIDLGIPANDINELKNYPLSPEEECYRQQLKEWKLKDDECLDEIKRTVHDTQKTTNDIRQDTEAILAKLIQDSFSKRSESEEMLLKLAKYTFKGEIESFVKSFHEGTRAWLFKRLDDWFADQVSRVMILTASPGFGKSVFAGKVCQVYKKKNKLAACHFCKFNDSNLRDSRRILESLASHMCDNVKGFKEKLLEQLKRPHKIDSLQDAFRTYLNEPLQNLDRNETMLTVVDGLDESDADGKSELLELIANEFPKLPWWIKILVTSRPEIPVKQKLNKFHPIEITSESKNNENDIRLYFESCLPRCSSKSKAIPLVVVKCQGSFFFASHLLSELRCLLDTHIQRHSEVTIEEIENIFPKGIGSVYERYFDRLEKELSNLSEHIDFRRILEVLVAADGPLPLTFLHGLCGLPEGSKTMMEVLRKFNDGLSSLLVVLEDVVTVFHKSVVDWLTGKGYERHRYTVNEEVGGEFLWEACKKEYEKIKNTYPNVYLSKAANYALDLGLDLLIYNDHVNISPETDYIYLIDPCLVHVMNTIFPVNNGLFIYLFEVLMHWDFTEAQPHIKRKLLFHYFMVDHMIEDLVANPLIPTYLQGLINNSLCDSFSELEKSEAKLLLTNLVWCEKMNSFDGCPDFLSGMVCESSITCVGISPNQKYCAVGRQDGIISLLKFPSLVEICTYTTRFTAGKGVFRRGKGVFGCNVFTSGVPCCTFSPDNSFVLYGDLDYSFDTNTQDRSPFFSRSDESFSGCSFSQSGTRLATADGTEIIKLWDITNKRLIWQFSAGGPVNSCSHSEHGAFLFGTATSSVQLFSYRTATQVVAIWNTFTRIRVDQRRRLDWQQRQRDSYYSNETSSNISGTEIVLSTSKSNFRERIQADVYVLPQCLPVLQLYGSCFSVIKGEQPAHLVACVKDSWRVIDCGGDELAVRPYSYLELHMPVELFSFGFNSFAINETFLLYGDEHLLTFKVPSEQQKTKPLSVLACSFSPDGSRLASCTNDNILSVWDVPTCKVIQKIPLVSKSIHCWWSQGYFWLFHSPNNVPTLSRFSVNQQLVISFQCENLVVDVEFVTSFIFAEGVLVLKGKDHEVFALSVTDEKCQTITELVTEYPTTCAAVSPGGSCILLAGFEGYVVWGIKDNWQQSVSLNLDKEYYDLDYAYGEYPFIKLYSCCAITSDGKHGIIVALHQLTRYSDTNIKCYVFELSSSRFVWDISTSFVGNIFNPLPPAVICAGRSVVVLANLKEFSIKIIDIETGKLVGYLDNCIFTPNIVLNHQKNILAFPNKSGTIDFVKIHGVQ